MADTHTLGKILERLELLTQGQKDLEKKVRQHLLVCRYYS